MLNKMLIDANHPEETRVIVLRGNRVEEFDFESADRKQLRGNIYLAKVTRVEPSLQAAFIEYGGNRHGFLAFSEIHPDYYQIPVADRQALLEEEARADRAAEDDDHRPSGGGGGGGRRRGRRRHADAAKRRHEETVSEAPRGEFADEHHSEGGENDAPHHDPAADVTDTAARVASAEVAHADATTAPTSTEQVDHAAAGAVADEGHSDGHAAAPVAEVETPTEPIADHSGLEYAPTVGIEPAAPTHAEKSDAPTRDKPDDAAADATVDLPAHAESDDADPARADTATARADQVAPETDTTFDAEDRPDVQARARTDEDDRAEDDDDDAEDDDSEDDDEDEDGDDEGETQIEQIGGDAMEEVPSRPMRPRRHYKIQEVIKRRQVLLVQVVKEERGTKGAALTTYLSLAGRYSVLMPNTARGGGISRKITDSVDRKRLKSIAEELEVPEGMGIILRTAGASRTKPEVKRDFEYLLRMWETVREVTLESSAPTLVYEEGSLIKRAIRDLYNKDVEEILVAGEDGYREAKDFMRLLMPSHAKNVQLYKEPQPIFAVSGAEAQLDGMYFNQVTLRSGGYIVINQTEALVAIDVNSGRSTREHNIEDTAVRTNLEAADEVARQLRLRDLAGLIVVDFIDMEEGRNNRAVERRMKDALKNDRARIQIGRISHFGLLEMSRQRIRTGVVEGSTVPCTHCMGTGMVRSTSSIALHVLRGLDEALLKSPNHDVTMRTRTEVALYILNQKRSHLRELEERFGVTITITADPSLSGVSYFAIERGELATQRIETRPARDLVRIDSVRPIYDDETAESEKAEDEEEDAQAEEVEAVSGPDTGDTEANEDSERDGERDGEDARDDGRGRGRSRRRRRRGGRDRNEHPAPAPDAPQPSDDGLAVVMEISGDRTSVRRERPAEDGQENQDGEAAETAEFDAAGEPIARGRSTTRRRRRSRRGGENRRPYNREELGEARVGEPADNPDGAMGADGTGHSSGETDQAAVLATDAAPAPQAERGEMADRGDITGAETTAAAPHAEQPQEQRILDHAPVPANDPAPHGDGAVRDGDGTPVAAPAAAAPEPADSSHTGQPPAAEAVHQPEAPAARPPQPVDTAPVEEDSPQPKRSGWWQRAKATFGG